MLRVDCPPRPGEAFPGYLLRVASALGVDPRALYEHLGLRTAGHTGRYLNLVMEADRLATVARELRLGADQVRGTLLSAFPGLDLAALLDDTTGGAHRKVQRAQWIFLSGTRYCVECVVDDGTWLNEWQLPWVYACPKHRSLLVGACSACGKRPDLVIRTGRFHDAPVLTKCVCGAGWTAGVARRPVADEMLKTQTLVLDAALGERAMMWGERVDGVRRLAAWRATCVLAVASIGVDSWSHRPFLVPPPDPRTTGALVALAEPVVAADTVDDAAAALDELMAPHRTHGEAVVWDKVPRTSPLAAVATVWLQRRGRVHARLARTQQRALELVQINPDVVPTLADPAYLPARWVTLARPDVVMRRAALSLAVARLAGAGTWAQAGDWVGIDGTYASRVVRHTLRVVDGDAANELTTAAFAYARSLVDQRTTASARPRTSLASAADMRRFARRCDVPAPAV